MNNDQEITINLLNPIPITHNFSEEEISGRNPIYSPWNNPDPYMIFHDGVYYCYTTGWRGVNVLRSDNLESFEHMGHALRVSDQMNYWAPSVLYYEGTFYMYYSSVPAEQSHDPFAQRLRVATADNPLGPFIYQKQIFDYWTIDPHVVEKDGELHLFFSAKGTGPNGNHGTINFYQKMSDPLNVIGSSRIVQYPTLVQEIFGDTDEYCLEGPFYFEHDGIGFLMYSANRWEDPNYFVGYSTIDASLPFDQAEFLKFPDPYTYRPLIGMDTKFTGMGHNSVTKGPNGEMLIVYHGRPRDTTGLPGRERDRRLCISILHINGKELTVEPN